MKTIILSLLMVTMTIRLTGQSKNNYQAPPTNYFIEKSKKQRDGGYVLLGLGTTAIVTTFIIITIDPNSALTATNSTGPILMLIGATMIVASVPLFISAGANRRKGMSVSLKNETAPYFPYEGVPKSIPTLSLKIGL